VERPVLEEALRHCAGNMTRTADLLGMNRATLRKKLDELGIDH
jgi:Fis family transcriptional regulator